MQMNDVEIGDDQIVYNQGVFQVKRLNLRFRLFSGQWSPWLVREQISRQDAVAVLLYDPKTDKVVLVEQLRIGAIRSDSQRSPWMLEIVAGLLEAGEDPADTATREVAEEAQCTLKALFPILDYYTTPGGFTEKTRVFCGIVDAATVGVLGGLDAEHEDIRIHVLAADQVLNTLETFAWVSSASTIIAMLWLKEKRLDPSNVLFAPYK